MNFVILVVLDGWGIAPASHGNAITQANLPNITRFWASYPHTQLKASGEGVGLPRGEVGNTETGHLNLGAGRIVYQDLERINMSIADGSFFENDVLKSAIKHCIENNSGLHIMGLIGAGGVHSNIEHLFALISLAGQMNFKDRVYYHLFTDGRDSPPTSALSYIQRVEEVIAKERIGHIASIMGRYWAMDRDQRWERTQKAYFALTKGIGKLALNTKEAIENSYSEGKTDEFIEPTLISGPDGKPIGLIKDNDSVIFFNFRIDRPRQLVKAFLVPDLSKEHEIGFDPYLIKYTKKHLPEKGSAAISKFERGARLNNLYFATMTEYSKTLVEAGSKVVFPPEVISIPLGRVISENGLKQLRVAESEKERFVTYYFNGLREGAFQGEERIIIPSPKVATYDLKPEMSAREITDALLKKLQEGYGYSFVVVNFANPDMVGHTGNLKATITACEVVDECVGKLGGFVLARGGTMIITADHGNAEEMLNLKTGEVDTEHSNNPVPFIAVGQFLLGKQSILPSGVLCDVAPTILNILKLPVPTGMTGKNLLQDII
jgi:2,3-bisphosphoglycerate-independent phosphoglycerate mutase